MADRHVENYEHVFGMKSAKDDNHTGIYAWVAPEARIGLLSGVLSGLLSGAWRGPGGPGGTFFRPFEPL